MQIRSGKKLRSEIKIERKNSNEYSSLITIKQKTARKMRYPLDFEISESLLKQSQSQYNNFITLRCTERKQQCHRKIRSAFELPKLKLNSLEFVKEKESQELNTKNTKFPSLITNKKESGIKSLNVSMEDFQFQNNRRYSLHQDISHCELKQKTSRHKVKTVSRLLSIKKRSKEPSEISSWEDDDFSNVTSRMKKEV